MQWASVTWEDFEQGLRGYRDNEFYGHGAGEKAYLKLVGELAGVPIAERGSHAASIVLFLNQWKCHFPTEKSRVALAKWIPLEADALQSLVGLSILDAAVIERVGEFDRLHHSLIALKDANPAIFTMSDACASKLLHQMVPPLFVMWDSQIRKGFASYGAFMLDMHKFGLRLRDELAPAEARANIEGYLQRILDYPVPKPLSKYIDLER